MRRALWLMMLLLACSGLRAADATDDGAGAATAIQVAGPVFYEEQGGALKPVEEGQLFDAGDRLVTKDGASLELALADGSTLSLGANSEMMLHALGTGGEGSSSFFEVLKGRMNAMVHKLSGGESFEVGTANGVAAVKGTQFEVEADGPGSAVTVQEGSVALSDAARQHTVMVPPLQRAEAGAQGLKPARALSGDEAKAFTQRWARAREVHAHRAEHLKRLAPMRRKHLARLARRRGALRQRLKEARLHADQHPAWAAARKRAESDERERAKGRRHRHKAVRPKPE